MEMVFKRREGYGGVRGDIRAIGLRMEELKERFGEKLTPADVYRDGLDPDSPLYDCFEHDPDRALERLNRSIAKKVMNCYVVIRREGDDESRATLGQIAVNHPVNGRVFMDTVRVMKNPELRGRVLDDAKAQIRQLQRRLALITDADEVIDFLERVAEEIERAKQRKPGRKAARRPVGAAAP
jgi:hypothetical protein